ncbi:HPF/RaiA family ribosome-associated protein [Panacibacter sp. DH6]|uniref:HPF/RaiA family ribosome-associated protein n=1 Tax=Panacibacter microcysteis TaxID=2793269 RepID=A0A931GV61_9BACT|nr:HPF/RaiA family ribosome-associated protein [Panacibacter microcysteis]MBG9374773.1 HPF/RaiA family ribosome-associated protein [Panacibacter microcysteis]
MDIIIQHLGFTASETLDAFIREKVNALKSDKIVRANVTLYFASEGNPDNQVCEIRLEVPGNDYFVKKGNAHFETAVSECVDILQNKLKKQRDINISQRHADEGLIQDELLANQNDDEETELEDVVK